MPVLIVYGTTGGSTRGIAERIGARLKDHGMDVVVADACDAPSPAGFEAVVIGSGIAFSKWTPEAHAYATRHSAELRARPVWLFSVSSIGDEESFFPRWVASIARKGVRDTPEIRSFREAFHPRSHRNFAGAITKGVWPWKGAMFMRALGGRYGDHRNWPAIDRWADEIAAATAKGQQAVTAP